MKMTTVREFRKRVATLMREGDTALITRHGKPSGLFLPLGEGVEIPMDLRMALVERGSTGAWRGGGAGTPATVQRSAPRTYQVSSTAPCLLVLSEDIYPWWRASVDDTPRELIRVNHTMIGLPLLPGSHVVRLWLQPTTMSIGIALSAVGLLLVPALLLV